jgi:biopolymer transport protein ExbD
MRFKTRRQQRSPEVNLIPMLDVLMTVLTFFIIVSMTLALERGIEVRLPDPRATPSPSPQNSPKPLMVKLTQQGFTVNDQPQAKSQVTQQVKVYLVQNPQGAVIVQATPDLPYERVIDTLSELKEIGGDRVSLALE